MEVNKILFIFLLVATGVIKILIYGPPNQELKQVNVIEHNKTMESFIWNTRILSIIFKTLKYVNSIANICIKLKIMYQPKKMPYGSQLIYQ